MFFCIMKDAAEGWWKSPAVLLCSSLKSQYGFFSLDCWVFDAGDAYIVFLFDDTGSLYREQLLTPRFNKIACNCRMNK